MIDVGNGACSATWKFGLCMAAQGEVQEAGETDVHEASIMVIHESAQGCAFATIITASVLTIFPEPATAAGLPAHMVLINHRHHGSGAALTAGRRQRCPASQEWVSDVRHAPDREEICIAQKTEDQDKLCTAFLATQVLRAPCCCRVFS